MIVIFIIKFMVTIIVITIMIMIIRTISTITTTITIILLPHDGKKLSARSCQAPRAFQPP